ncbi:WD40 repeat-like protein [Rozella allomycis CSF55]|uniref:WD40 repeat-like protein n=1 Tax=Rozella allomycis (strain CSF55) TaxID=988480 RepID=A0A4P9YKP5_ROZAC|nr:WD40 repeat-like protein [Rozella allomycis CSF55]
MQPCVTYLLCVFQDHYIVCYLRPTLNTININGPITLDETTPHRLMRKLYISLLLISTSIAQNLPVYETFSDEILDTSEDVPINSISRPIYYNLKHLKELAYSAGKVACEDILTILGMSEESYNNSLEVLELLIDRDLNRFKCKDDKNGFVKKKVKAKKSGFDEQFLIYMNYLIQKDLVERSMQRNVNKPSESDHYNQHSKNITCVDMNNNFIITGSEDRRVYLWTFDKPDPLLTMLGHAYPISSVTLDEMEEIGVAGSTNGTIKLWDLQQNKIIRTFTGHKNQVTSLRFHPHCEFFASGSENCLKVWDIKRKVCIQNYALDNASSVNDIEFSPDGRWVAASAGDKVHLWDLTAQKLLYTFCKPKFKVRSFCFHPNDILLSMCDETGCQTFWDLEMFQCISEYQVPFENPKSLFADQGQAMIVLSETALASIGWEPQGVYDAEKINIPGNFLTRQINDTLYTVGYSEANLLLYSIDLKKLRPFNGIEEFQNEKINVKTTISKPPSPVSPSRCNWSSQSPVLMNNKMESNSLNASLSNLKIEKVPADIRLIPNSRDKAIGLDPKSFIQHVKVNSPIELNDTLPTSELTQLRLTIDGNIPFPFDCASFLITQFSPIVKTTLQNQPNGKIVDIQREERINKCMECHDFFKSIYDQTRVTIKYKGPITKKAAELEAIFDQNAAKLIIDYFLEREMYHIS